MSKQTQHEIICELQAELAKAQRETAALKEYKEMAVKREQALRTHLNAERRPFVKSPKDGCDQGLPREIKSETMFTYD